MATHGYCPVYAATLCMQVLQSVENICRSQPLAYSAGLGEAGLVRASQRGRTREQQQQGGEWQQLQPVQATRV